MALSVEDQEDPFWVAAFEGRELDARDELMPDREHEEIGEAALTLSRRSRSENANGLGGDDNCLNNAGLQVSSRWTPAEVKVCTIDIPLLANKGYGTTYASAEHVAIDSSAKSEQKLPPSRMESSQPTLPPTTLKVCVREVLSDGVLSVTGGELWPAARILAQLLAGATIEPSSSTFSHTNQEQEHSQDCTAPYSSSSSNYTKGHSTDADAKQSRSMGSQTASEAAEKANSANEIPLCSSKALEHSDSIRASLRGARVLELGAGLGLVGLVSARLGAKEVALSEVVPSLLSNLDATVALNEARFGPFFAASHEGAASKNPACAGTLIQKTVYALPLNWCDWQPSPSKNRPGEDLRADTIDGNDNLPRDKGTDYSEIDGLSSNLPSVPRAFDGACYEFIVGSELVYAPHHRYLADLIFDLLRAHQEQQLTKLTSPISTRQACCVIVQRADRPGWAHFLTRARNIGLAVRQVAVQEIADAIAARESAARSGVESFTESATMEKSTNATSTKESSEIEELAAENDIRGNHEGNEPVELGPSGIDLSPYVLCELTLPTSRASPPSMANSMKEDELIAEKLTKAEACGKSSNQSSCESTTWPSPAVAYLENIGRIHRQHQHHH